MDSLDAIDLRGLTERDKQGMLIDELNSIQMRFSLEYQISQASFLGALEVFKANCLSEWMEKIE